MQAIYQAKGLGKSYGHKTALENVNFEILPGRLVGLLGPTGRGKTTLL